LSKGIVYIVDDEEDILDLVEYNLVKDNFFVERFTTGKDVLDEVRQKNRI